MVVRRVIYAWSKLTTARALTAESAVSTLAELLAWTTSMNTRNSPAGGCRRVAPAEVSTVLWPAQTGGSTCRE